MLGKAAKSWAVPVAVLFALKILVTRLVWSWGFESVSDDDFARVVIAEQWAQHPKFDASGTSWLPAPFWIVGAAMRVAGANLDVARCVAAVLGACSIVFIYLAALWITEDRQAAFVGGVVASVFPWSARLGAATVPELSAAALSILGLAALSRKTPATRFIGATALLLASLSRYEAWILAAAFGFFNVRGLRTLRGRERVLRMAASAIGVLGPSVWITWNQVAHGDAFHFVDRVRRYARALREGNDGAVASWISQVSLLSGELLLALLLLVALTFLFVTNRFPKRGFSPFGIPVACVGVQVGALLFAASGDAAPTHHPERVLLPSLLLLCVVAGRACSLTIQTLPRLGRPIVGAAVLALVLFELRLVQLSSSAFALRNDESAMGRLLATRAAADDRVILPVRDYGYFAVMAASGRPWNFVLVGSPGLGKERPDEAAVRKALAQEQAQFLVMHDDDPFSGVGKAEARVGKMVLFRLAR